jgi:hypothetical protein
VGSIDFLVIPYPGNNPSENEVRNHEHIEDGVNGNGKTDMIINDGKGG